MVLVQTKLEQQHGLCLDSIFLCGGELKCDQITASLVLRLECGNLHFLSKYMAEIFCV